MTIPAERIGDTGSAIRTPSLCLTCGHDEADHYTYTLNGCEQGRCRACDPLVGVRGTNIEIISGSETDRLNKSADHDFKRMLPMR